MPPLLSNYLSCLADEFTPVRDTLGRLLGCVPRVPDNAQAVPGEDGSRFELGITAQVCVMVNLDEQQPAVLPGFIPFDNASVDLAVPAAPDNTDVGEPV